MRFDRRSVLAGGLCIIGAGGKTDGLEPNPLDGQRLFDDVVRYAGFGDHRTGGPGDRATVRWLTGELSRVGYAVDLQPIPTAQFALDRCEVRLSTDRSIAAFPIWPPTPTPPAGITAPLTLQPAPNAIALIDLPFPANPTLTPARTALIEQAIDAGAAAVIVAAQGPFGELVAFNVPAAQPRWRVPVAVVAGRDANRLHAAVGAEQITLVMSGATRPIVAHNVIARRSGPCGLLAISTPLTGWFTCGAERGSGVALWLGLARLLARTDRNVLLVGTTGHEFNGLGSDHFLAERAPPPREIALWLHLGANLAARGAVLVDGGLRWSDGPASPRGVAASVEWLPRVAAAFAGQSGYADPVSIDRDDLPGEAAQLRAHGFAPLIGMLGTAPYHHTPHDFAAGTTPSLLGSVAGALAKLAQL